MKESLYHKRSRFTKDPTGPCNYLTIELKNLSKAEKLIVMEALWEDLSNEESIESPDWHKQALSETEARVLSGQEKIIGWQDAKKEIMGGTPVSGISILAPNLLLDSDRHFKEQGQHQRSQSVNTEGNNNLKKRWNVLVHFMERVGHKTT